MAAADVPIIPRQVLRAHQYHRHQAGDQAERSPDLEQKGHARAVPL